MKEGDTVRYPRTGQNVRIRALDGDSAIIEDRSGHKRGVNVNELEAIEPATVTEDKPPRQPRRRLTSHRDDNNPLD